MAACDLISKRCKTLLDNIAKEQGFYKYELTVSRAVAAGENYSGDVFKVAIACDESNKSLRLVIKVSPKFSDPEQNRLTKSIYETEAYVYTKMLPVLDKLQKNLKIDEKFDFPKLYAAVIEKDEQIIVMEDMSNKGYRMLDKKKSLDYEHLVVCIKTIARFHATSFVLKAKLPKVYEEIRANTSTYQIWSSALGKFIGSSEQEIRKLIKNKPHEKVVEQILNNLIEEFNEVHNDDASNSILIHGDTWNNNFLFKDKETMILLDWQLMRNASPIVDLSFVVMLCLDSKIRSKYYHEILDLYYEVLSSNMKKIGVDILELFPPSIYKDHVKKYMKYCFILGFVALPIILGDSDESITYCDVVDFLGDKSVPYNVPISDLCRERFHELVEDCVQLNII